MGPAAPCRRAGVRRPGPPGAGRPRNAGAYRGARAPLRALQAGRAAAPEPGCPQRSVVSQPRSPQLACLSLLRPDGQVPAGCGTHPDSGASAFHVTPLPTADLRGWGWWGGGPSATLPCFNPHSLALLGPPNTRLSCNFFIIQESPLHKFYTALSMNYAK